MLDCLIVGAGPAGAIAALVLARGGARVSGTGDNWWGWPAIDAGVRSGSGAARRPSAEVGDRCLLRDGCESIRARVCLLRPYSVAPARLHRGDAHPPRALHWRRVRP